MDFPKGCSSNVHVVENLAETRFFLYSWKDDPIGVQDGRHLSGNVLTSLRELNVLCARGEESGVWVFGEIGEEQKELLTGSGLHLEDDGNIEEHTTKQTHGGRPLKDVFLDAVEAALAYRLAQDSSITRIGPWHWIYSSSDMNDERPTESTVMRIHTRLTSTSALYLIPQLNPSRWCTADLAPAGSGVDVLIAPHGGSVKTVPNGVAMKNIAAGGTWRLQVQQSLHSEGIVIDDDEEWLTLYFPVESSEEAFEWPRRLCLVETGALQHASSGHESHSWRSWFAGSSSVRSFRNPLASAEEWFMGAAARARADQQMAEADSSVNGMDEPLGSVTHSVSQNGNDANMATSPLFNQRNLEQQAAIAGIYPTPPDGLTQSQQMPNINAVTTPSVLQADQGPSGSDVLTGGDDVQFKANDFNSSAEPESYQMEQEDLFGDVGEMEFGDHEVGDADFSFFDEPDEDPIAPAIEDTEMLETSLLATNEVAENAIAAQNQDSSTQEVDIAMTEPASDPDTTVIEDSKLPGSTNLQSRTEHQDNNHQTSEMPVTHPEKPLSPFGIRERLLPPPVPASVAQKDSSATGSQRRSSTFSPIAFRDGLHRNFAYSDTHVPSDSTRASSNQPGKPDITLPSTRKKSRLLREDDGSEDDSESEEGSYDSDSSESEKELPPKLPWDNRKRKRHINHDSVNSFAWLDVSDVAEENPPGDYSQEFAFKMLERSLTPHATFEITRPASDRPHKWTETQSGTDELTASMSLTSSLPYIDDIYELRKDDFVYIAQVISEASLTAFETTVQALRAPMPRSSLASAMVSDSETLLQKALSRLFPAPEICDLGKVALTREPPPRPGTNPGKGPPGQPRPLQRADSMMLGPDYFPLPAPYVRIQRGTDHWEMLPASLCFWEPLGLGPSSGPKNVRAFCLFPSNEDLQQFVEAFIRGLGTAFESCKLGSHVHLRNASQRDDFDNYEDGMAPVELGDDISLEGALKAYAAASAELGQALSSITPNESDRSIVIYMINPFEESAALQHLCACFWLLFKAYRDNLPKGRRNQCVGDIVLQIIPIDAVASFDGLVVPDAKQMAALAREVYDRCPPSTSSHQAENMSPLPILVAPSVELASAAPKRIGFQLIAEPPGDLLHEGSVLHLAYATSRDGQWLTAAWIDSTGQHQSTVSFCLRGKSFADVAEEVWERTREIMAARQVTWRIFILTSEVLGPMMVQCWRTLVSKPRKQPICVTLLSAQVKPALQLFGPAAAAGDQTSKDAQDAGFLTPASTPQGNNFTSSPDVSGHGNAPLTPAPSETAASMAENDPDAHLTDITDETWGLLLSPKLTHLVSSTGIANGMVFKRGDVDTSPVGSTSSVGENLPSLGVSLHWTIQVKPSGAVDEGSIRQAELTLRELLKLYRNLALLTRAKGLDREDVGPLPLHVAMAMRGAKGLEGMLTPVVG